MNAERDARRERAADAERAGREYFRDHPCADHATAAGVARNRYRSTVLADWFVAGWNREFWGAAR